MHRSWIGVTGCASTCSPPSRTSSPTDVPRTWCLRASTSPLTCCRASSKAVSACARHMRTWAGCVAPMTTMRRYEPPPASSYCMPSPCCRTTLWTAPRCAAVGHRLTSDSRGGTVTAGYRDRRSGSVNRRPCCLAIYAWSGLSRCCGKAASGPRRCHARGRTTTLCAPNWRSVSSPTLSTIPAHFRR